MPQLISLSFCESACCATLPLQQQSERLGYGFPLKKCREQETSTGEARKVKNTAYLSSMELPGSLGMM